MPRPALALRLPLSALTFGALALGALALAFGAPALPISGSAHRLSAQSIEPAGAPSALGLTALLEAELRRFPARVGLHVKHMSTGIEVGIGADEAFNSQSVIKMMILVRAFQLADEGVLDLEERITLTTGDLRHGAGLLQFHDPGITLTLRDLLFHMVVTSDNIATDLALDRVGGTGELNRWIRDSGYTRTWKINQGWEYRRKLLEVLDPRFAMANAQETTALQFALAGSHLLERYGDLFTGERADWLGVVRDPVQRARYAEARDRLMVVDTTYWLGHMTPRETSRLLEGIEACTVASRASCDAMRLSLRQQQAGARRLPHYLTVPIGHKTGDSAVISNDVGIIYARSGPIVVSFFVNGIQGPLAEAEDRMGRIAQLIVDYFDGAAGGED
jgi:beta-lactamase class A